YPVDTIFGPSGERGRNPGRFGAALPTDWCHTGDRYSTWRLLVATSYRTMSLSLAESLMNQTLFRSWENAHWSGHAKNWSSSEMVDPSLVLMRTRPAACPEPQPTAISLCASASKAPSPKQLMNGPLKV